MLVPQLSLQERDRRYKIVRAEMARRNIACLLLPANTGRWEQLQADSRYLTSIGGFATEVFTVFPLEGEVTAYIFNRAGWWKQAQNWVQDVRDGRNRWGENAVERIKELGVENRTIGIAGLAGLFRAPEGIIPYSSVQTIQNALPQAKLINVTEMMQEIRAVKSAEEIAFLERSTAIIEKTIEVMVQTAESCPRSFFLAQVRRSPTALLFPPNTESRRAIGSSTRSKPNMPVMRRRQ